MVRRFALALLLSVVTFSAAGGDIAIFENLGFSANSQVFLFGQYGIDSETGAAFADVYAVDVPSNRFVSDGTLSAADSDRALSLGQDGRGALFHLIGEAQPIVERYAIDHLSNGRLIYILVDGDEPKSRIAFRDFNSNVRYVLELNQQSRGDGDSGSAAFSITLTVTYPDSRIETKSIGNSGFFRDGVQDYRIRQVLLNPDEDAVVVVVEKRLLNGSLRYMVETAPL